MVKAAQVVLFQDSQVDAFGLLDIAVVEVAAWTTVLVDSTATCVAVAFHDVAWVASATQVCKKEVVTSTYVADTRIQGYAKEAISIPMAWANCSSLDRYLAPILLYQPSLFWRLVPLGMIQSFHYAYPCYCTWEW